MAVPSNIRHKLPNDPAILLLGIYPKELKAMTQTDNCTPIFIVALITAAKKWKQPKCSLRAERISKMSHVSIIEYYSAFKRKKSLRHTIPWMKLEDIMLSEINYSQKGQIPYNFTYMRYLPQSNS